MPRPENTQKEPTSHPYGTLKALICNARGSRGSIYLSESVREANRTSGTK